MKAKFTKIFPVYLASDRIYHRLNPLPDLNFIDLCLTTFILL
ncbi:hypothetical protein CKA32_001816 [Geitlerinema sp. FC II]|nr:hypothetical protein CKA32_001816 [Geitlerinema sp. FC II]